MWFLYETVQSGKIKILPSKSNVLLLKSRTFFVVNWFFQIFFRKQNIIFLVCLNMEYWIIIQDLVKVENRKKNVFRQKIFSWIIQELVILLINWVSTLQTSLNPRWSGGSTCISNSTENQILKFYWRILKGTFSRFFKDINDNNIWFSFTSRSIFLNHNHQGDLIRIDKNGYSLMIDYFVSMR